MMNDVCDDDQEGVSQVDQEPHLHWLDGGRGREGGGHREIHRGEDHHAGDVHCDHQVLINKCSVRIKRDENNHIAIAMNVFFSCYLNRK